MFPRFKGLMTLFAILCVAAIAGGSAYFYFGGKVSDDRSISNETGETENSGGVTADNILENYEFGTDKDLNETYTYYFFPSTLYMSDDFFKEGLMPETVFGYNEVILDDNGDPVLDSSGQPQYNIVKDNIVGMKENTTYYDYLVKVLNNQESSYLADGNYASLDYPDTTREVLYSGSLDNPNYYYYYKHQYFRDPYVINNPYIVDYLSHEDDFNPNGNDYYTTNATASKFFGLGYVDYYLYFYMHNGKYTGEVDADLVGNVNNAKTILNGIAGSYTSDFKKSTEVLSPIYADPESIDISNYRYGIDLKFTDANRSVINTFLESEGRNIKLNDEEDDDYNNNMMGRSQYRNDRFGFWSPFYDLDDPNNKDFYIKNPNSANRYLPIKITVNGNLTPDDMAKVIPTLSASMFDSNMWFDFSANVWTYVPYVNNAYSFESKEYTTGTGGFTAKDIKNIFDIMQNPSKYADKDGNIRLFPVFSNGKNYNQSVENGGSDAIQASFTYNDSYNPSITNDLNPSSTKMTYSSYTFESYYSYKVNYAVLKNIMITKDKFTELKIRIDTTDYAAHWSGRRTDIYTFTGTQLNNLISIYGEGLYTFYFFVGGRATNTSRGSNPFNGNDLISRVTADSSPGNELYKKYLLPLSDDESLNSIVVDGAASNRYVENSDDGIGDEARPVALAVEKVTNLRLVSDIPIAEDESGEPSDNQDWTGIDNSIKQGLLNAKNFTIADEVYSINEETYNSETINLPNDGTRIDSDNPYIYVIQNADFRFVNNLYFQIRFSNDYIANSMNVVTDYKNAPDGTQKFMAYSIQGEVIKFKFQDSQNDNDYFIQNVEAGSGETERQGFKLKDYNARGIFDILLVSTGTEGGKQSYNMYVNRHKNSFIKLFNGNPGTFEFQDEGTNKATNNFVRHKLPSEDLTNTQVRVSSSTLLWNGQTYLGEYLTSKTVGTRYSRSGTGEETPITDTNSDNSLFAAIQACCGVTPGTDTIYVIKDAVTGQVVAYYNSGVGRLFTSSGSVGDTSDSLDLFTIVKNYVLYIEEVKFNLTT